MARVLCWVFAYKGLSDMNVLSNGLLVKVVVRPSKYLDLAGSAKRIELD